MSNLYDILKQINSEKNIIGDISKKVVKIKNNGNGEYNKEEYVEKVKQIKEVPYDTIKSQAQKFKCSEIKRQ